MTISQNFLEPNCGDRRFTIKVLASGQPRPYADSINHVRLFCEMVPYSREPKWQPDDYTNEATVRKALLGMNCGFTEFTYPPKDKDKASASDYFATRLDWLKKTGPGTWEFHTTSAYTD